MEKKKENNAQNAQTCNYESPCIEVICIDIEGFILQASSVTGEDADRVDW